MVLRENYTSLAFILSLCNSRHDKSDSAELPLKHAKIARILQWLSMLHPPCCKQ